MKTTGTKQTVVFLVQARHKTGGPWINVSLERPTLAQADAVMRIRSRSSDYKQFNLRVVRIKTTTITETTVL